MDFEERTISSTHIFKGRIIEVKVDQVRLPNGGESTREIVLHAGAVAIIALDDEQNLHLVRQYRKPLERTLLEIPAGILEDGERPLHAAQRELEEETGIRAGKWEQLLTYYSSPGFCDEVLHIFLATGLQAGQGHLDEDEFVETAIMPLEQAYEAITAGEIVDGKSIIAIQCLKIRKVAE